MKYIILDADNFPMEVFGFILCFAIGIAVARLTFSIPRIVGKLSAIADLLAIIAKKQGTDETIVDNIIKKSNK